MSRSRRDRIMRRNQIVSDASDDKEMKPQEVIVHAIIELCYTVEEAAELLASALEDKQ